MGVRVPPPALITEKEVNVNITTEELGDLHQVIHIEIADEDYRKQYDKQIKDLVKKIQLPGFRTGHTPIGLIQKRFGDSALADELNKIVNEQVRTYLETNNLSLLGEALPLRDEQLDIVSKEPRTYTFSYEMGIQPTIDVAAALSKDKVFTQYRIAAKDSEIDQEIERLQKRYGNREDVEKAEEGDVIYLHLEELNSDGSVKENGVHAHSFFNYEMLTESGLEIFKGISKDKEDNIADIFSVFKGDRNQVAKNVLMLEKADEETVEAIQPAFHFKVERISRLYPAALDDKFFNEIVREYGEVEDETQLRSKIKEVIEGYNDRTTSIALENDIYTFLKDNLEIRLPETFLRRWFRKTIEKEISEEEFEKEFAEFTNRLRQSIIFQHVQKAYDLNATKEEVVAEAFETTRISYGHLGEELVSYVANNNLQDKNFVENMHDRVMQKKFFGALKNYITVQDEETTLEEFQKINAKEETYAE